MQYSSRDLVKSFLTVTGATTLGCLIAAGANLQSGQAQTTVTIPQIQGAGHISPLAGQTITTQGIVTAVDSNGFYLQDPVGDGDAETSDGIFVFTSSRPTVSGGDQVRVSGSISEFIPGGASTNNLSTTQFFRPQVSILSTGNPLPAPVIIGAPDVQPPIETIDDDNFNPFDPEDDGIDFYESVEAMRVTVKDALAISPTNRFGEIYTVANRGKQASGLSQRGTINISPDDFNPERVQVQFDSGILPGCAGNVNVGARLGNVTGVVGYGFGNYEVYLTECFVPKDSNLRPERTRLSAKRGSLTVASYNVLNLDPNDGDGDQDGANGRFDLIASQIVNNLQLPDVIGLQEVQDNSGSTDDGVTSADETLALLVERIAAISGVQYEFIDNPFIGNNTSGGQPGANIRTAFLYNPERVELVENSVQTVTDPLDQQTNPDNPFFDTRLPLVAKFEVAGEEITVINNHFSSKSGSSPLFGQLQPSVERQEDPLVNGSLDQRRAQAETVRAFVDAILEQDDRQHGRASAQASVVVLGDFNEFEFISPLEILEESLVNLTETLPPNERYSYIFEGNSQSLDHILVSPALAAGAAFDAVHVNAEFVENDQQASDHDPLVTRLAIGERRRGR